MLWKLFLLVAAAGMLAHLVAASDNLAELQDVHKNQAKKFFNYLRHNVCKHLYLDMGTNIGMQFRKLYEPHLFPRARSLPYFSSTFGDGDRRDVCALGFEPNSLHKSRLLELQAAY